MTKKIVVIGGGNGTANILNALKQYVPKLSLSAVVSMSDSGGSQKILRKYFNILPPADILRAVLAMSPYDYNTLKKVFYGNRLSSVAKINTIFSGGKGTNLGSLFITLLTQYAKDYMGAIRAVEQAVEAVGHAYPNTISQNHLCAELTNGMVLKTEAEIDRPTFDRKHKIQRVWLEPRVKISSLARKEILSADVIVLSNGSLYTSVVAALLPTGIKEAIKKSKAKLVYVAGDAYEMIGETGPDKLSDFVKELEVYLPRPIDVVLYNNCKLTAVQRKRYKEKQWAQFVKDPEKLKGRKVIGADFTKDNGGGLSAEKLAPILKQIIFKS